MRVPSSALASALTHSLSVLAIGGVILVTTGCPGNEDTRASLAAGCSLNSQCTEPLVCVYRRCHNQCETSRDCAPGQRCVLGERPDHVCQLPEQSTCSATVACVGGQTCGKDGKCRDACRTDSDCVTDQACVQGQCAEPDEVQTLTLVGASQGGRCTYSSECDGKLVCIDGRCEVECVADRDCFATWKCKDTRCLPPGAPTNCPAKTEAGVELGGVRSVAAGGLHTCVVRNDQSVWCWGSNASAQLGQGAPDAAPHFLPATLSGFGPAVQVVAGDAFTCALTGAGQVYCWGADADGQLGRGTVVGTGNTPAPVVGLGKVTQITAGERHACALEQDGTVKCWGRDATGQLGRGVVDALPHPQPSVVQALGTDGAEVSAFVRSTCARRKSGAVACWGDNAAGQLGRGAASAPDPNPQPVQGLTSVTELAKGPLSAHACAVQDSKLFCWGEGSSGEIGDGSTVARPAPAQVAALGPNVVRVGVGSVFTCATTKEGATWCWGLNDRGMLGDGSLNQTPVPVQVVALGSLSSQVSGGGRHSCGILKDASLFCWGANDAGQLADGTTVGRPSPVLATVPCPVGP